MTKPKWRDARWLVGNEKIQVYILEGNAYVRTLGIDEFGCRVWYPAAVYSIEYWQTEGRELPPLVDLAMVRPNRSGFEGVMISNID